LNQAAPEPHYELGKLHYVSGDMKAARDEFERVIHIAPSHANAHYQLSRVYAALGDAVRSHEMAERTRELKQAERDAGLAAQRQRLKGFAPVAAP
jgi:Tfp pilus assembly protein PilF